MIKAGLFTLVLLTGVFAATGCQLDPMVCTMEFRSFHVKAVDAQGNAVHHAEVSVVRSRGSLPIDPCKEGSCNTTEGAYTVLTDAHYDQVSRRGDTFLVTLRTGELVGTGRLEFFYDGCHVSKRSGPEVIVLK